MVTDTKEIYVDEAGGLANALRLAAEFLDGVGHTHASVQVVDDLDEIRGACLLVMYDRPATKEDRVEALRFHIEHLERVVAENLAEAAEMQRRAKSGQQALEEARAALDSSQVGC